MDSNHSTLPLTTSSQEHLVRKNKMKGLAKIGIIFIICLASIIIGLLPIRTPQMVSSDAPLDQFSAERALEHLNVIAKVPHPTGSVEIFQVRDYLIQELQKLGLEPELQKSNVVSNLNSKHEASIENIIVRIPGLDNSKAVMVAAHYDSVPTSPGAADDGAAIAAILEMVRALQVSEELKNDLILLLSDGEEKGLLGAQAFVDEHPWAQDVGLVLNFEARGNKGPSVMFETTDQNGWIIKEFLEVAEQPLAYSLLYNVYKLMPNYTDMTEFRETSTSGLNFAFGMGLNAYHHIVDTPENLDKGSLQHHGDYMLTLTKHFGQLDLNDIKQEDRIYFNAIGWSMIHYPQSWALWFMIGGVLLFIGTIYHGIYKKRMNVKEMMVGFLFTLLSIAAVFGLISLLWAALKSIVSIEQYAAIVKDQQISTYFLIALLLLTSIVTVFLIRWASKYFTKENISISATFLWLILAVVTTFYLPGGSYLFIWPFIFSLLGINLALYVRTDLWEWISVVFAIPGIVLFTPIFFIVFNMLTLNIAGVLFTIPAIVLTLIFPVFCSSIRYSKKNS